MNSLSVGGCVPIVSLRQLLQCGAWGDIVIGNDNFDQGVYAFVLASGNADVAIDLSCCCGFRCLQRWPSSSSTSAAPGSRSFGSRTRRTRVRRAATVASDHLSAVQLQLCAFQHSRRCAASATLRSLRSKLRVD